MVSIAFIFSRVRIQPKTQAFDDRQHVSISVDIRIGWSDTATACTCMFILTYSKRHWWSLSCLQLRWFVVRCAGYQKATVHGMTDKSLWAVELVCGHGPYLMQTLSGMSSIVSGSGAGGGPGAGRHAGRAGRHALLHTSPRLRIVHFSPCLHKPVSCDSCHLVYGADRNGRILQLSSNVALCLGILSYTALFSSYPYQASMLTKNVNSKPSMDLCGLRDFMNTYLL